MEEGLRKKTSKKYFFADESGMNPEWLQFLFKRMDDLDQDLRDEIKEETTRLNLSHDKLDCKIDNLCDKVNNKINSIYDKLEGRIDTIDKKLDGKFERFDNVIYRNTWLTFSLLITMLGGIVAIIKF